MDEQTKKNTRVIDRLVEAYNAGDARAFAALFTEDAPHGTLHVGGGQLGREEIERHYTGVFARFPQNRTEVLGRLAFGPYVIDHERVRRSEDAEPFEVVAIYTLRGGLITRLDFLQE